MPKKPFMQDTLQKLLIGVLTALLLSAVSFGVVQIGKVGNLERIIQELPSPTQTVQLSHIIIGLQEQSAKNNARILMLLFMLKEQEIMEEQDVKIILDTR
jgi:hypothetical protein